MNFLSVSSFNVNSNFGDLNDYFAERPLDEFLSWCLSTFSERIAQVSSFGSAGMVLLDHLARLRPGIKVITIDTDFLFEETYALHEQVQGRYPIQLEIYKPTLTPEMQTKLFGPNLPQNNPNLCCHLRKVLPLQEALQGLDAWMTGLRRDQSSTRANLPLIMWDEKYQLVKINPLANWTRNQIWNYILEHRIPYNPLHDQGYASIGCTYCTSPTVNPTDERSGRWLGFDKIECGIHQQPT
jgi:phosphoadenosine phosphosulfate reductase